MTLNPLDFNNLPSEAAVIPFPKPETTPPVTNINFILPLLYDLKNKKEVTKPTDKYVVFF